MASITSLFDTPDLKIELTKEPPKPKTADAPARGVFEIELPKIFKREGGYVNDLADPGGETMFGITRRSHPEAWVEGRPTVQRAADIYRRHYWEPIKGDYLPPKIAAVVFDYAVNSGVGRAATELRRSLGMGDGTSIDSMVVERALAADQDQIAADITSRRLDFFDQLVAKSPEKAKFLPGWRRRAQEAFHQAGAEGDILKQDAVISRRGKRGINPGVFVKPRLKTNEVAKGILAIRGGRILEERKHANDLLKNKNSG